VLKKIDFDAENVIVLNAAFMQTLSRAIREYNRSRKAYSAGRSSAEQFDAAFAHLMATLRRPEAQQVFSKVEEFMAQSPSRAEVIPPKFQNDIELLIDFETRILSPVIGNKKKTSVTVKEAFDSAEDISEDDAIAGITERFQEIHEKSKNVIAESRSKKKQDKKKDKKAVKSALVRLTIGIACIMTNHFFLMEFSQVSGMTGFSAILLAAKRLENL
jgi:hypothetical protein